LKSLREHWEQLAANALDRLRGQLSPDWYRARGMDIGANVYIGRGSTLDTGFVQLISVGAGTVLSSNVEVLAHDASTRHHLGYTVIAPVRIGQRVYVGAGSIILPGVTIGDDAVIGAGSVVTRDVPEGTVAAGNPARVINTTEQLVAKHRARMRDRPVYDSRGWTSWDGGVSSENQELMRHALADGPGYIK
jgi:maltose O-acetyltransferase